MKVFNSLKNGVSLNDKRSLSSYVTENKAMSIININRLMLYTEIIVYFANNM